MRDERLSEYFWSVESVTDYVNFDEMIVNALVNDVNFTKFRYVFSDIGSRMSYGGLVGASTVQGNGNRRVSGEVHHGHLPDLGLITKVNRHHLVNWIS
jgi:hypothetical protein